MGDVVDRTAPSGPSGQDGDALERSEQSERSEVSEAVDGVAALFTDEELADFWDNPELRNAYEQVIGRPAPRVGRTAPSGPSAPDMDDAAPGPGKLSARALRDMGVSLDVKSAEIPEWLRTFQLSRALDVPPFMLTQGQLAPVPSLAGVVHLEDQLRAEEEAERVREQWSALWSGIKPQLEAVLDWAKATLLTPVQDWLASLAMYGGYYYTHDAKPDAPRLVLDALVCVEDLRFRAAKDTGGQASARARARAATQFPRNLAAQRASAARVQRDRYASQWHKTRAVKKRKPIARRIVNDVPRARLRILEMLQRRADQAGKTLQQFIAPLRGDKRSRAQRGGKPGQRAGQ